MEWNTLGNIRKAGQHTYLEHEGIFYTAFLSQLFIRMMEPQ